MSKMLELTIAAPAWVIILLMVLIAADLVASIVLAIQRRKLDR